MPEDTSGAEAEAVSFAFDVPASVQPGVILKVKAPDGVTLQIPLPGNVLAGDRMVMQRSPEGKWLIKHVIRGEVPPAKVESNGTVARKTDEQLAADLGDPNVCTASLHTTKGIIKIRIVPSWAPTGAQRFLQLITDKYYTDLAIYRAVPNFLIQFGVINDDRSTKYEAIQDDGLRGVPIVEGMVCFAASGPDTRTATICIFLGEYPQLGVNPWETPIGKVCPESLEVLRSIFTGYGDMPQCGGTGPDPIELQDRGNGYILENFPKCDFVKSAAWDTAS